MYQDNFAGGLEPTVMQLMSYIRLALSGACSLLRIVTLSGPTATHEKERGRYIRGRESERDGENRALGGGGGEGDGGGVALMAPDQKASRGRARGRRARQMRALRCLEQWPRDSAIGHRARARSPLMRFKRVVTAPQLPPRTYCRKTYILIASPGWAGAATRSDPRFSQIKVVGARAALRVD